MNIRILFMDVDGTLTDGTINMGPNGEMFKSFNAKDGYGIKCILSKYNILPVIVTGRESQILKNRCNEIDIHELVQNSNDKVADCEHVLSKYGYSWNDAAFIGDDLNDFEAMKMCAVRGCPKDAVRGIKEISDYITETNGGAGAVREFIEWIVEKNQTIN